MLLYRNQSKVDDTVNNATINADGTKNGVNSQVTKEILMKEAGGSRAVFLQSPDGNRKTLKAHAGYAAYLP